MPLPHLATKTTSPQSWRRRRPIRRRRLATVLPSSSRGKGPGRKLPKTIVRFVLIGGVALLALGGFIGLALVGWVAKDLPNPNRIIDRSVAESTKIYDRTGKQLLFDIHGAERRTLIPLPEIPEHLKNATLTAEDRKFYEHRGISFTGILRSVIKNLATGSKVSGSTLTQQLVKNAILTPEKTYTRKIREILLSWQIERSFSKDEILQLYFNEIPYGSVAYGAEAAAQTYFGKSVRDITLPEAAILAALPQAPTYYSPYGSHTDALFARQRWILDSMAELGYITTEEARLAKNEHLIFKERREDIIAPHFVMYVREYLTEKYGELAVEQGGLTVITTLDLFKHELAEKIIDELAEKNLAFDAKNAALVAIDPKTGQILVMIGSKNFFDEEIDGQVNVATRPRQPGSSFKPIVYAAALDKGYTPETLLFDVETNFLNYDLKDYQPRNYDLVEHGPVTMAQALAGSLNIPAVKTIYLTGIDNVIDLAEKLGYTSLTDRSRYGLALVLGGGEVQLLEHTNAYATLAREGEYHPPAAILEVRDKDGNILEEYKRVEKKALSTQVARQINQMLSDNDARAFIFGQSNYLNLGQRPAAVKTGTTNDYHDAWTVGYTPSLAVGVWVGNSNNDPMRRGADGSVLAAPIWQAFMQQVLGDTPIETFKDPEPSSADKPTLSGGITGGDTVKINRLTGKLATNQTPPHLVEERAYREAHSILHYLNKDNPQGTTPPERSDEQYQRWEEAVARWAAEHDIASEQPPTEFDTDYTSSTQPTIAITSPNNGQRITSREFRANVSVSATRGVSRVEYYLNDQLLGDVREAPFDLVVFIDDPAISTGFFELRAVAYDPIDHNAASAINLNLQIPEAPSPLRWQTPANGVVLTPDAFPLTLSATIQTSAPLEKIDVYYSSGSESYYINTARQFPGGNLRLSWTNAPSPGTYQLYAEITTTTGYHYQTSGINITIP